MTEILTGAISQSLGLREALEIVAGLKDISSGVLQINGGSVSGRIGIAWGRYLTGAVLDSGESGKQALRKLLLLKEGKFAFIDTLGEPVVDLRQSLGIDLNGVVPYVPDELNLKVTPWLFDADEQSAATIKAEPVAEAPATYKEPMAANAAGEVIPESQLKQTATQSAKFWLDLLEPEESDRQPEPMPQSAPQPGPEPIPEPIAPPATPPSPELSSSPVTADGLPSWAAGRVPVSAFDTQPFDSRPHVTMTPDAVPSSIPQAAPPSAIDQLSNKQAFDTVRAKFIDDTPVVPEQAPSLDNSDTREQTKASPEVQDNRAEFLLKALGEAGDYQTTVHEPGSSASSVGSQTATRLKSVQRGAITAAGFAKVRQKQPTPTDPFVTTIFCLFFFVVSCAGTIAFGPSAWDRLTQMMHGQH